MQCKRRIPPGEITGWFFVGGVFIKVIKLLIQYMCILDLINVLNKLNKK